MARLGDEVAEALVPRDRPVDADAGPRIVQAPAPRTASQVLGRTLWGRYEVEEPISSGATGAVYRALDLRMGEHVALKQSNHPNHDHRFEIEAGLLASLQHPRVVRIVDHFADETGQFLVMDLVRGMDLGEVLKRHGTPGLPVEHAIEYVRQACEALQYVHGQQIIHRDVKPQNMILGEDGIVLVDFGIARVLEESELVGTVGVGTPRYMAPEVFAGGAVSARTDVFGIAATLWTLLAGRAPVYADAAKLSELSPGVSPELERTICAGLEMIPERRVASIAAFAKALGAPLQAEAGISLAVSIEDGDAPRSLLEAVAHTAAGIFGAAAASLCLVDETTGELVYQSAWGAGRARSSACGCRRDRASPEGWWTAASARRYRTAPLTRDSQQGSPRELDTCRTRCSSCRSYGANARSVRSRYSTAATVAATSRTTLPRRRCSPTSP
jgi:hypothetical protein